MCERAATDDYPNSSEVGAVRESTSRRFGFESGARDEFAVAERSQRHDRP
jgi:hypothetical protein